MWKNKKQRTRFPKGPIGIARFDRTIVVLIYSAKDQVLEQLSSRGIKRRDEACWWKSRCSCYWRSKKVHHHQGLVGRREKVSLGQVSIKVRRGNVGTLVTFNYIHKGSNNGWAIIDVAAGRCVVATALENFLQKGRLIGISRTTSDEASYKHKKQTKEALHCCDSKRNVHVIVVRLASNRYQEQMMEIV